MISYININWTNFFTIFFLIFKKFSYLSSYRVLISFLGTNYDSVHVIGHGQEAENRFPTKFCPLPRWFSYDDDCSSLQKGRHNICRLVLAGFYLICCLLSPVSLLITIYWHSIQEFMIRTGHMHVMWMKWTGYCERSSLNYTRLQFWKMYSTFPSWVFMKNFCRTKFYF